MTRRLVICCDGTWNVPDHIDRGQIRPSNVVHVALAAAPRGTDGREQVVFYDKGVGTGRFDHLLGAFGVGLSAKVKDAYRFIVERYEPGDEIFLFGFSRGAYTARSVAGLIRSIGVLTHANLGKLDDGGYALYRRRDSASDPSEFEAQLFRKMYACEPLTPIHFIGVWDTVGALGIPVGIPWLPVSLVQQVNQHWAFHDLRLSRFVKFAYHAVAIDERREQYAPTLWRQQPGAPREQVLEQVWFAGVHTNVGGGYEDSGLSAITLTWMKEKAEAAGLSFDDAYFAAEKLVPNPLGVLRDARVGFYRLLPAKWRPIGVASAGHESIHESVHTRQREKPSYRPRNVQEYDRRERARQ